MKVKIKLFEGGKLPEFKTKGACCADCYARLNEDIIIPRGQRRLIPLGFAADPGRGYEVQIRPRSGLTRDGIDAGWGTGDWDYTGEYMACIINKTSKSFIVHNGDRIAQMAIRPVPKIKFKVVKDIKKTERGSGGFGHTGIK